LSEDSNCYKFGLISTLRTHEKKRIRHRDISKTVLERDLFTLNNLPPQVVHSRITSDLIPLSTLKSFDPEKMNYELVLKEKNFLHLCQEIKEILEKRKITVSMHSSQFFSLASDDKTIRENSQAELIYYANILSLIAKEAIITIQLNSKRELVEQLGEEKYLQ
ncbi:10935_t:CDS:2, partial [Cetraspora pellucida]